MTAHASEQDPTEYADAEAMLAHERAKSLASMSLLFASLGISAAIAITLDFGRVLGARGEALCGAIALLYVAWLLIGLSWRRRGSARLFLRRSIVLLVICGCLWGLLVTRLAWIAPPNGQITVVAIIMALIATPMLSVSIAASLAFWIPTVTMSSVAIATLLRPFDHFMLLLFGGWVLFTLAGIHVVNANFSGRMIGHFCVHRRNETIRVLMERARPEDADWAWQTDAAGRLRAVCGAFASRLGIDTALLEGMPLARLIGAPAPAPARNDVLVACLADRRPFRDLEVAVLVGAETRLWSLTGHPVDEDGRFMGFSGIGIDLTERRAELARMQERATRDGLTGLANRSTFVEQLDAACDAARRGAPDTQFALVLLDLDHFKDVNDRLGHETGDATLCAVARTLRHAVGVNDVVGRLGGDEFAVLLPGAGLREAAGLSGRLQHQIASCLACALGSSSSGSSLGIALCPRDGGNATTLLRHADLALYAAKRRGRGTFAIFDDRLGAREKSRRTLQDALADAIERRQIDITMRPSLSLATGATIMQEAVPAWSDAPGVRLSPAAIQALARDAGIAGALTSLVVERACAEAGAWDGAARLVLTFRAEADWLTSVEPALARAGLDPGRLAIAIAAPSWRGASPAARARLAALRTAGAHVLLDDFGADNTDPTLLRACPVDGIRLAPLLMRRRYAEIRWDVVRWSAAIAHDLDLYVIAQGVDDATQRDRLTQLGVDAASGRFTRAPGLLSRAAA